MEKDLIKTKPAPGKIIEFASGKSYFEFVDENILKPAGMKNTGCFELDKVNENLAVGYDKVFDDKMVEDLQALVPIWTYFATPAGSQSCCQTTAVQASPSGQRCVG